MNSMYKIACRYPLSCMVALAIWVVCLIPIPETPLDNVAFIDKWTHFVMYGGLTMTIWGEYLWHRRKEGGKEPSNGLSLFVGVFLLPAIMGGLIELAQAYLTTCRSGDVFDFLCNTLGVCLGNGIGLGIKAVCK